MVREKIGNKIKSIKSYSRVSKLKDNIGSNLVDKYNNLKDISIAGIGKSKKFYLVNLGVVSNFLSEPEIIRRLGELTNQSAASIYDKAMDAEYLKTHIAGGMHRLYDGGHSLLGSWEKVKEATNQDAIITEFGGVGIWCLEGYYNAKWYSIIYSR